MIDFIRFSKIINVDELMTENLCFISRGSSWIKYQLEFRGKIELRLNLTTSTLTISGSLPYFIQGHNFYNSANGAKQAIEIIESLIGIALFDASVLEFEYGVVVKPDFNPQLIFLSHNGLDGFKKDKYSKSQDIATGAIYKRKSVKVKIYDVWANINSCKNKVASDVRKKLRSEGYYRGDNSIKFEFHYNRPQELNDGHELTVTDMLSEDFKAKCQTYLLNYYQQMNKNELLRLPKTKDDASTISILLMALAYESDNVEESVNKILNALYPDVLDSNNKSARRGTIKRNLKKLESGKILYSIENLVRDAFKDE